MSFGATSVESLASTVAVDSNEFGAETFLSVSQVANLEHVTDRAIRKACAKGKFKSRMVLKDGHYQLEILLSSLPIHAQDAYIRANKPRLTPLQIEAERLATIAAGREKTLPWTPEQREARWDTYARSHGGHKKKAQKRQEIMLLDAALQESGKSAPEAETMLCEQFGISPATVWRLRDLVRYQTRHNWLPALLPGKKGKPPAAEFSPEAFAWIKQEWACASKPALADVYQRCLVIAPQNGWTHIPSYNTVKRRIEDLDRSWVLLSREGVKAATALLVPAQQRDYSKINVHGLWSSDGHKLDVMTRFSSGHIGRAILAIWYDQRTRYVLGYAISQVENADVIRLALRNAMVNSNAVPDEVLIDNGRAYTSSLISGGTPNRYRGKVKEEDTLGILTQMGVAIHYSLPGRGQSKPIERLWGSLTSVSKQRQFAGAYCGNNPTNKPEEFDASKAVDIAVLEAAIVEFIERYNNRAHRGDGMNGKSPRAMMEELLKNTVVTQPTKEQLRLCLLAAESVRLAPDNSITILGNRYWSEDLAKLPSRGPYTVRFNPESAIEPVSIYDGDNFICEAPCIAKTGFQDQEAAKTHARAKNSRMKADKLRKKAQDDMDKALLWGSDKPTSPPVAKTGMALPVPKVAKPLRTVEDLRQDKPTPTTPDDDGEMTIEQFREARDRIEAMRWG